ncbi:MAG: hypothetical protein ACE5LS_05135 [Thermoplasmata archaeon]
MEQPLRTLFMLDLRPSTEVRFRPLVFYAVFAVGFVLLFGIESFWLASMTHALGIPALPNPLYEWIAIGLLAALVSFKWERGEPEAA